MFFTPLYESLIGHLLALLDSDECLGPLAPLLVCNGRDTAFEDVRMSYDNGFEGYGGDVFATYAMLVPNQP